MKDMEDRRLPCWPAALNKGMAAAYSGMSYDFFSRFCPVKPIRHRLCARAALSSATSGRVAIFSRSE